MVRPGSTKNGIFGRYCSANYAKVSNSAAVMAHHDILGAIKENHQPFILYIVLHLINLFHGVARKIRHTCSIFKSLGGRITTISSQGNYKQIEQKVLDGGFMVLNRNSKYVSTHLLLSSLTLSFHLSTR